MKSCTASCTNSAPKRSKHGESYGISSAPKRRPGLRLPRLKSKAEKLQAEVEQANTTMAGLKDELVAAKNEADKLRESMKVKDDDIAWLRSMWPN